MVIAALRSALTYIVIALYVAVAGTIGLAIALPLKLKGVLFELGHYGIALAMGLSGIRYRVSGRQNVPSGTAVVYCSNHQSNIDPLVLYRALDRRLHILFKAELRKVPILGMVMETGGFIPVLRENREEAMDAIDLAAASIRDGNSFLIFPEGTRSLNEELLPFKKGGFIMAIRAQAPIVPVAVSGGRDAMRKGSAIIRPVVVDVKIGEPVLTAGYTLDDRDLLIAIVRERIEAMLRH